MKINNNMAKQARAYGYVEDATTGEWREFDYLFLVPIQGNDLEMISNKLAKQCEHFLITTEIIEFKGDIDIPYNPNNKNKEDK